jgi:flavin reductase (DIM6/NTAB) family NADH-FMN oxidoreductase RutF
VAPPPAKDDAAAGAAGAAGDFVVRLKAALRGMPGPVALITTCDNTAGQPAGLAASAVIPVCMAPPSMLVCVNRSASAHAIIEASGRFCINLIGPRQTALVDAFSSAALRDRRFKDGDWDKRHGLPYLPSSPASLFCVVRTTLLFGTHEAFVGEVFDMTANGTEQPVGWLQGAFAQFKPLNPVSHRSADQNGTLP